MAETRLSDGLGMADWVALRNAQLQGESERDGHVHGDVGDDAIVGGAGRDQLARPKAPPPKPLPTVGAGARKVQDFLAKAERTTPEFAKHFGFTSDYDVPFNYGRSGAPLKKPLSAMTLAEIRDYQRSMRGSSAVGRYQFMPHTLSDLTAKHGLEDNAVLDGPMQDQLARSLMQKRKYDAYCAGQVDADTVMDAFAAEWASLPMANGFSRYTYQGKPQPVRVTRGELKAVLDEACRLDFGSPPAPASPSGTSRP
jgi:hypothetical protein